MKETSALPELPARRLLKNNHLIHQKPMTFLANTQVYLEGVEAAKSIADSWELVWSKVLLSWNSQAQTLELSSQVLYTQLCHVGLVFASGLLIFLGLKQYKDLTDGNYEQYFLGLFMPLIVVILLSNSGQKLAELTMGMRHFINQINLGILDSTVSGINLEQAYQEFREKNAYSYVAPNLISQCETLTGQEQLDCLATAVGQIQLLDPSNPTPPNDQSPSLSVLDLNNPLDKGQQAIAYGDFFNRKYPIFSNHWETAAFMILNSFQSGYQQLLEGSLLLTALLGPVAVGGSLTPLGGSNALVAWLTGFYSIAFAKLGFNIVAGLAAVAANIAGPTDPLPLATITGIFAPVLSAAIATGGGLAVWQAMTGAAEGLVGVVTRFVGNWL